MRLRSAPLLACLGPLDMLTDEDPEKAKRTAEAIFAMKKLDIAALAEQRLWPFDRRAAPWDSNP